MKLQLELKVDGWEKERKNLDWTQLIEEDKGG